jgi:Cdc6-like AAA superfamily ATPase
MSAINLEYNIPSVGILGIVNYDMIEEEMCLAYNTMYNLTPEMLDKVVERINSTQNNAILQQFIKAFKDDFALNIHITDERFKILIKKIVDLHY